MHRSRLEDFDIICRLGSGSFGTVYKVQRLFDGNNYVIKEVRIADLSEREQNDAINEVQILAHLDSLYVVKYFDSFIENKNLHIGKTKYRTIYFMTNTRPLSMH